MTLDIQIRNLLRSNEVRQINFSLRRLIISGHGFDELSNCFTDTFARYRIRVTVNPRIVPQHAQAQYDQFQDKVNLHSANVLGTNAGRGTVVHECTHALADLRAMSDSVFNNESVAFIAEAWFYLALGLPTSFVESTITSRICAVAQSLRGQAQTGRRVAMTADEINSARDSVRDDFGYRPGHYTYNGIRGRRYRGE